MRTMTPIAVLCWYASTGQLPVAGTWAFWIANPISLWVFGTLALGEYIGDVLPRTPSRTDAPLAAARLAFGVLVGLLCATALHEPKIGGILFGGFGALIGTFTGHRIRVALAARLGRDWPIGLLESALALALALRVAYPIAREAFIMHEVRLALR